MISIIQTGGKQYLVQKGDKLKIEKIQGQVGEITTFDKVLFTSKDNEMSVGKPFLSNVKIEGKILSQGRGDKVRVFKYKPKSKYRRTQGHRQDFTEVEII